MFFQRHYKTIGHNTQIFIASVHKLLQQGKILLYSKSTQRPPDLNGHTALISNETLNAPARPGFQIRPITANFGDISQYTQQERRAIPRSSIMQASMCLRHRWVATERGRHFLLPRSHEITDTIHGAAHESAPSPI